MAFGFQVLRSNGNVVFDSNEGMSGTAVTERGTASAVTVNDTELLLVRPTTEPTSGNYIWFGATCTLSGTTYTYNFIDLDSTAALSMSYMKIQTMNNITVTGANYGITVQEYGQPKSFDSRAFSDPKQFEFDTVSSSPYPHNTNVGYSERRFYGVGPLLYDTFTFNVLKYGIRIVNTSGTISAFAYNERTQFTTVTNPNCFTNIFTGEEVIYGD